MHMADALVSGTVAGVMMAASLSAVAYSVKKIKDRGTDDKVIPLMGVMGAFVFAAQMVNFTIPFTGSSGHIGGGILLAAVVGGYPALIAMVSVLIIQCLFFADGGMLALGANIFNLGVLPCLIGYTLIFKPIVRKGITAFRLTLASLLAVLFSLQLGSFCVVLETTASGVTELPFLPFLSIMQPIHLAIGFAEGLITAAVLSFVYKMRPEIIAGTACDQGINMSAKGLVVALLCLAVLVGGGLSLTASGKPDGLEWSIAKLAGSEELTATDAVHETAGSLQEKTAILPDYEHTSLSGLVGGALTLLFALMLGLVAAKFASRNKEV